MYNFSLRLLLAAETNDDGLMLKLASESNRILAASPKNFALDSERYKLDGSNLSFQTTAEDRDFMFPGQAHYIGLANHMVQVFEEVERATVRVDHISEGSLPITDNIVYHNTEVRTF